MRWSGRRPSGPWRLSLATPKLNAPDLLAEVAQGPALVEAVDHAPDRDRAGLALRILGREGDHLAIRPARSRDGPAVALPLIAALVLDATFEVPEVVSAASLRVKHQLHRL